MIMTTDTLMEQASQALARMDYLETERLCLIAMTQARQDGEWQLYARIILPLQECRRQRRLTAALGWTLLGCASFDQARDLLHQSSHGCLLLTQPVTYQQAKAFQTELLNQPRHVELLYADNTADAEADTWTLRTILGQPLTLAIHAPPAAWRQRLLNQQEPWPDNLPYKGTPPCPGDWFIHASELLGNAALEQVIAPVGSIERIEQLVEASDAVPDHELIHQHLAQAAHAITA